MQHDLETLKEQLWRHFEFASDVAGNDRYAQENRNANRAAVGTIGAALVALEREERERAEARGQVLEKPSLKGA
jgi:hypothetical protein